MSLFDRIMRSIDGRNLGFDRSGSLLTTAKSIILGYDSTSPVTISASGITGTPPPCFYTLAAGTTHNLGPAPTSGAFAAGVTKRLIATPNAGGSTVDSIANPGIDDFSIVLYNSHLTRSLTLLDQNNAATAGTAGNLLACPNPNGLAANAIESFLPPGAAQRLTWYSNTNAWVFV